MGTQIQAQLDSYGGLVADWSHRLALVAPGDLSRFRERHIDDCLRLLPLLQECPAGPAVDVGSGAGLPGVVLAIALPERAWCLLEPRSRRAGFLEHVVRKLELPNVEVVRSTAQQAPSRLIGAHALAVARALAPPARALALLAPLVAGGGVAAVFVGKDAEIPPGSEEWKPGIVLQHCPEGGHGPGT
jgi:16S rRNA (guanine527-N7)-methyltransferase